MLESLPIQCHIQGCSKALPNVTNNRADNRKAVKAPATGTVQRMVLLCMADGAARTVRRTAEDMLLNDTQVRGAMDRLYRQGLVAPERFDHYGREWVLTGLGMTAYESLYPSGDDE